MLAAYLVVCGIIYGITTAGPEPIKDLPLEDPMTHQEMEQMLEDYEKDT